VVSWCRRISVVRMFCVRRNGHRFKGCGAWWATLFGDPLVAGGVMENFFFVGGGRSCIVEFQKDKEEWVF